MATQDTKAGNASMVLCMAAIIFGAIFLIAAMATSDPNLQNIFRWAVGISLISFFAFMPIKRMPRDSRTSYGKAVDAKKVVPPAWCYFLRTAPLAFALVLVNKVQMSDTAVEATIVGGVFLGLILCEGVLRLRDRL